MQVAGGAGGAARPVLSPDGKYLAFIRRIEFDTVLMLRNLESGNEMILFRGLSIDQQGSYSPTGNYPTFSFVPTVTDAIIIWAQGKFWKINLSDGVATQFVFGDIQFEIAFGETVRANVCDGEEKEKGEKEREKERKRMSVCQRQ